MSYLNKIGEKIKQNKTISVVVLVAVLLIAALVFYIVSGITGLRLPADTSRIAQLSPSVPLAEFGVDVVDMDRAAPDTPSELEVKEGSVEIRSKNADTEADQLRSFVEEYDGYIEHSWKTETLTFLRINITARVPAEKFDELVENLQDNFDVRSYQIRDFRITIQHQLDELDILRRALEDYARLREQIGQLGIGEERISLLMSVTDKETELVRRQQRFERDLATQKKLAEMATLNVSFEQKLMPKIWPEDLGTRFLERLNRMVDSIVNILIGIVTNSLVVLVRVIEYIIYAIIVLLPIIIAWRLLRPLHRRFTRNE